MEAGEVFALLGHNGAGKTTLMKLLLGLVRPTCGEGAVFGLPLGDRRARARLGYQPEQPYLYPALTVSETLEFMAGLSGFRGSERRRRCARVVELCGLQRHGATRVRKLSRGWLQRVTMAAALLPDPELVLLDEPLGGLDPEARASTKELIRCLRQAGTTVWLNSHILPDVESLADRVALLADGRIAAQGSLDDLLNECGGGVAITYSGRALEPLEDVVATELAPGQHRWVLRSARGAGQTAVLRYLLDRGVEVQSVAPQRERLESFYARVLQEARDLSEARPAAHGRGAGSDGSVRAPAA